jgi:RNA polymerase sigma factor (sigma-70 family)
MATATIEAGVDLGPPGARELSPGRRELAGRYVPLARSIARQATGLRWLDGDERESAALEGLCRAARSYDEGVSNGFAAYARRAIGSYLVRVDHSGGLIHASVGAQERRVARKRLLPDSVLHAAERANRGVESLTPGYDPSDDHPGPASEAEANEEQARFRAAIDRLPTPEREVILDRLANLNQRQSAALRGIAPRTVRIRIGRGVARLRGALVSG